MKKFRFLSVLFVSIFCLYSCESTMNNDTQTETEFESKEMSNSESSIDAVLSFVKEVYPQKYKTLSLTKEALKPEFVTNASYERSKFFAPSADNTNREIDTLLSVINFGNDEGFAIVSTKYNQVLAVTENGNLSAEELIMDYSGEDFENNPKAVISNYVTNYIIGSTIPVGPTEPLDSVNIGYMIRGPWVTETQIQPFVQLKLHQGYPYNMYCPKVDDQYCPTGCAAIALTQMMSANKYPNRVGSVTLTWENIIERYPAVQAQRSLALWIKAVADECKTEFAIDQSGASVDSVILCLASYPRYTNINIKMTPSYEDIYPMLANATPPLFASWDITEDNDTVGHMWVVDGCIYQKQSIKLYDHNDELIGEYYETQDYVHCNWGWNGTCNGYYFTNIFNLNNGAPIPDEGTDGSGNLNFDYATLAIRYNFE